MFRYNKVWVYTHVAQQPRLRHGARKGKSSARERVGMSGHVIGRVSAILLLFWAVSGSRKVIDTFLRGLHVDTHLPQSYILMYVTGDECSH